MGPDASCSVLWAPTSPIPSVDPRWDSAMTRPPSLEAAVRLVTSVRGFLIQERTQGLWRDKKGTRPACGPEPLIPSSTKVEQKYSCFWLSSFSLAAAAGIWHRRGRSTASSCELQR